MTGKTGTNYEGRKKESEEKETSRMEHDQANKDVKRTGGKKGKMKERNIDRKRSVEEKK